MPSCPRSATLLLPLPRSPSQRDSDTDQGPREVRDSCGGHSGATDPGHPGAPSHHKGADDDCGESVEWDLLWVSPYDVGVIETTAVALQAASEP